MGPPHRGRDGVAAGAARTVVDRVAAHPSGGALGLPHVGLGPPAPLGVDWGIPGVRMVYDHRFDPRETGTTLTWVVTLDGPLASLIRPVFAGVHGRNLDRAIPRLQEWIAADRPPGHAGHARRPA